MTLNQLVELAPENPLETVRMGVAGCNGQQPLAAVLRMGALRHPAKPDEVSDDAGNRGPGQSQCLGDFQIAGRTSLVLGTETDVVPDTQVVEGGPATEVVGQQVQQLRLEAMDFAGALSFNGGELVLRDS